MKEYPILFSAPMVRAIRAGTKTQTRRLVKGFALQWLHSGVTPEFVALPENHLCPYGYDGDLLWGRETHAPQADCWGSWERWSRGDGGPAPVIHYAADFTPFLDGQGLMVHKPFIDKWRPSIHMPRWACRLLLDVTAQPRIERLKDISAADAIAEGCTQNHNGYFWGGPHAVSGLKQMATAKQAYRDLWESINGPGSWDENPWVWAVTFKPAAP